MSDEHQHSDEEHKNILKFILKNITTFWSSECSPRISSKSLWGPGHMA